MAQLLGRVPKRKQPPAAQQQPPAANGAAAAAAAAPAGDAAAAPAPEAAAAKRSHHRKGTTLRQPLPLSWERVEARGVSELHGVRRRGLPLVVMNAKHRSEGGPSDKIEFRLKPKFKALNDAFCAEFNRKREIKYKNQDGRSRRAPAAAPGAAAHTPRAARACLH